MQVPSLLKLLLTISLACQLAPSAVAHTNAIKTCDCDSLDESCPPNSRIIQSYTPATEEYKMLSSIGAGKEGNFAFTLAKEKYTAVNDAGGEGVCKGVERRPGMSAVTTFTTGVVCTLHRNVVSHRNSSPSGYTRCRMELYLGTELLARSANQEDCLADFDE